MKKFLVISYYDGNIEVDNIFDTYQEAKEFMIFDVFAFIEPLNIEELDEDKCWISNYSAFANVLGDMPCDWVIKEIEV